MSRWEGWPAGWPSSQAACGSGALSDNGPFGNSGQNSGTLCYPARPGGVVQDGFEEFYDTGIDMYYHVAGTHYLRHFTDGLKIPVGHKCD